MKKFLLLTILASLVGFVSNAQYTTPRTGTGVKYDLRNLNHKYINATDATGADSAAITFNAYRTTYRVVLVDSFTLKQPVITNAYAGDEFIIVASAASGTPKLKFTGSNWQSTGTATLSTGLRAVIRFIFDGAKWVEASRVVQ